MAQVGDKRATRRIIRPELLIGGFFLLLAIGFLSISLLQLSFLVTLRALIFYFAALFFIAAAGFLSASLADFGRLRGRRNPKTGYTPGKTVPRVLARLTVLSSKILSPVLAIDWVGDWLSIALAMLNSLLALFVLWKGWHASAIAPSVGLDQLVCASLLACAFLILILERRYASMSQDIFVEAGPLDRVCRLILFALLGFALSAALNWLGLPFSQFTDHTVAVVLALIAIEFCLRSAVYFFVPLAPIDRRKSHIDSVVAGLIRAKLPDFGALNASVRRQFGIDLARSWALGFVRRASLPLLFGMALLSWLLTGVTALGINQRAVYEAFGQPQGVLGPGLHLHWPWPFGVLRLTDFGTVRAVPIEFVAPGTQSSSTSLMTEAEIESAPPSSADRIWGDSHPNEGTYLIAANNSGRESFGVVDVDMSVIYRIGLSDAAAEQAIYNVAAPADVIGSISSQMLSRYLAGATINEILGQNRNSFIRHFQMELQSRLTALSTGIEIMGVVVEAIHPPSKAASSYQGVQTAAIQSIIDIATASAEAAREMKMANVVANATGNDAAAAAEERIDQAKADFTLFDSDRQAFAVGGEAFLFERRLDRLEKGLADKPIVIVDHRIPASAAPTLDLRGVAIPKSSTDEGDD